MEKKKADEQPADDALHDEKTEEENVTEFKTKLNKYQFLHVPKNAITSLPFKAEEKLKATIEGKTVVICKA